MVAAFYSLSHIPRHPLGMWQKSSFRENTEHSRLEHFICFQNPRQGWCGEVGEDHPLKKFLSSPSQLFIACSSPAV